MQNKFSLKQFHNRFPDNDACMEEIKQLRFGDTINCLKCKKNNKFYRVSGRSAYACAYCGYHIYPLKGSIFDHSSTELTSWFYAIYIMAQTRAGISAKQLERELGVTYKTAWRMFHQIRTLMACGSDLLTGEVEVDETYLQPRPFMKKKLNPTHGLGSNYSDNSQIIFGMVERGGSVKAAHVISAGARVLLPRLQDSIAAGTTIYSDQARVYKTLKRLGYLHDSVNHSHGEYGRGLVHTNTIEGFWGQLKRSIDGTYHCVSPKYLQSYVNEFVYRYNHRTAPVFPVLIASAARRVR
jgi:transposase-like protein